MRKYRDGDFGTAFGTGNTPLQRPPQACNARIPKTNQPVEKVVVGPVGGPKEARNKAKTLRKRRFQPLLQTLKRARRSFSTRWIVLDTFRWRTYQEVSCWQLREMGLKSLPYQLGAYM